MSMRFKRLAGVAIAVLFASSAIGAAPADRSSEAHQSVTDEVTLELAESHALDVESLTVQGEDDGSRFLADENGDWVLQIADPSYRDEIDGMPESVAFPMSWSVGVCVGNFTPLRKVSGGLQWGGSNSCSTSSTSGVFPHYIDASLRSTCAGSWPLCGLYSTEAGPVRSNNIRSSRVANIYNIARCDTNANYRFANSIRVTVKGVQYGPYETPGGTVVACNVTA